MKSILCVSALICILPLSCVQAATLANLWDFESPNPYNDKVGTANGTAGANITTTTGHDGGTAMVAPSVVASSASYVDIADTNITAMAGTGFSVSFWVKMDNDGGFVNRGLFDFSGNGGDTGIQGLFRGGTDNAINCRVDGVGTPNCIIAYTGANIEDGQWHHIVLTFVAGTADGFKLYLDGTFATSVSTSTFTASTGVGPNSTSFLGSFNFTGASETKGLNGALDDFGVWSGVLTAAEVYALAHPVSLPAVAIETTGAGSGQLRFTAPAGYTYHVEESTTLASGSWITLGDPVAGDDLEHILPLALSDPRHFYRISRSP